MVGGESPPPHLKERQVIEMWKCDLMELLKQWPDNLLIDSIRLNAYGEIVIETTTQKFYIYRDNKIVKFK